MRDANAYGFADSNGHVYSYSNSHGYVHTDPNTNGDSHSDPNADVCCAYGHNERGEQRSQQQRDLEWHGQS